METTARGALPHVRLPLLALLGANAISLVGSQLTSLAIPWFVLQLTGSATKTGLTAFVNTLPAVLAGFFGGTLVDRLGYKRASVAADLLSGVSIALVPLLLRTGGLAFWQLLVLVFLRALLDTPGATARRSLLPDLAVLAGWRLERVNAAAQAIGNLAGLLGPPLAGLLIVTLGSSTALWVDAASFVASAAIVAAALPRGAPAPHAARTAGQYVRELGAGLRFVRRQPLILALTTIIAIVNFLGAPLFAVILPVYALRTFGSAVSLGLMAAGFGGGALGGTLLFGAVGHRWPRRATVVTAFLGSGLPFWLLIPAPGLAATVAALALVGVAVGVVNPLLATLFQERTPAELRGRVFGVLTALGLAAAPLGMVLAGSLLAAVGVRWTLGAIATAYALVTVSLRFHPAFRMLDNPADDAPAT